MTSDPLDLDALQAVSEAARIEHEWEFPWKDLIDGLDDGTVIGVCECDEAYLKAIDPPTVLELLRRLRDAESNAGWVRIVQEREALRAERDEARTESDDWRDKYSTDYAGYRLRVAEADLAALRNHITRLADEWHRTSVHEGKTLLVTSHARDSLRALLGDTSTPTQDESDKLR